MYIPDNFERDLEAARRPQIVAFYNQQYLTATGIVSAGISDGADIRRGSMRDGRIPQCA